VLALDRALRVGRSTVAAFVGAGGKTTALALVSRAQAPCFAAATSHFGDWQTAFADSHVVWPDDRREPPDALAGAGGVVLVTGPPDVQPHRLRGLDAAQAARLSHLARDRPRPLFVEADGSRRRPLKAPAAHEPPIPEDANLVVSVVGLAALGQPLDEPHVHRPDRFAALTGCAPGAPVTVGHVADMLLHAEGGRKRVPSAAAHVVLLNHADTDVLRAAGEQLAALLVPRVAAVLISRLAAGGTASGAPASAAPGVFAVRQPVAATVLAAGASSRLGRPKPLLDYRGRPFVRAAAEAALAAGLAPVQVVVGAGADAVAAALTGLPVTVVRSPEWQEGQAASIRAAVSALPANAGATVFLLADQPQIPPSLVSALVEAHARTLAPVVAPVVGGTRANPVLFDRDTFPRLLALRGDVGGRAVITAPHLVPWPDASILIDVDTEEDYRGLLGIQDPGFGIRDQR
jgi:molybdenum cofactor cytidylyltransferase